MNLLLGASEIQGATKTSMNLFAPKPKVFLLTIAILLFSQCIADAIINGENLHRLGKVLVLTKKQSRMCY